MTATKSAQDPLSNYDYMNENSIDGELTCALCMQPFQLPLGGECGHTFCKECIEPWITRNSTCPTCRVGTSATGFRPISTRIVINQLDRLLMRCKRCRQENIQRGNISEHDKRCPDQTVPCPAFDIKYMWKGTRNALPAHVKECSFHKIRPAIDEIYSVLNSVYVPLVDELQAVRQQLEKQTKRNSEQNRFLVAVFNKGKPMGERCTDQSRVCPLQQAIQMRQRNSIFRLAKLSQNQQATASFAARFSLQASPLGQDFERKAPENSLIQCTNCQNDVDPDNIALHHCQGGCICRKCVEMYGNVDASTNNPGTAS